MNDEVRYLAAVGSSACDLNVFLSCQERRAECTKETASSSKKVTKQLDFLPILSPNNLFFGAPVPFYPLLVFLCPAHEMTGNLSHSMRSNYDTFVPSLSLPLPSASPDDGRLDMA